MALTLIGPGRSLRSPWHGVARPHGLVSSGPAALPADWAGRYAFRDFVGIEPEVTLAGRVPERETWVAVGGRGRPVVCAARMPGLALPLMAFYRAPGTKHDTVTCSLAEEGLAEAVVLDDLMVVVARTLPAYAELVLEGDTLALVSLAGVAAKPWQVDEMLACLRGLVAGYPVTAP